MLPSWLEPLVVDPLFEVILIETHNQCTRTCWFCKFGQQRQDADTSQMSWQTIERIVGNLKELDYRGRISWFWINEPLMDSRILDIVAYTRRECPDAFLSLVTNGDLLTDAVYKDLRRSGLDALGVSIYDTPAAEHAEAIDGDDRLVLMDMRRIRPPHLENRAGNIKRHSRLFTETKNEWSHKSCGRPFSMMTVNANGQVALCCSDLYSDVIMGDVNTHRLEQIWNNESFRHYRSHLNERGRQGLPLCGDCSFQGDAPTVRYPLRPPQKRPVRAVRWMQKGAKFVRSALRARL
jgi:radical SAM protein with 4Fe4S-binding SPASM domain